MRRINGFNPEVTFSPKQAFNKTARLNSCKITKITPQEPVEKNSYTTKSIEFPPKCPKTPSKRIRTQSPQQKTPDSIPRAFSNPRKLNCSTPNQTFSNKRKSPVLKFNEDSSKSFLHPLTPCNRRRPLLVKGRRFPLIFFKAKYEL